ncbi:MAG: DUF58 domain-containing protein [Planctomycetales bacterium]|nr:DUF58 domain-containing protein [Planctomycetales bacterium]
MHEPQALPKSQAERSSRFFEPAKLAGLEKMRFTTTRRVEGAYSGRHVAKRRGGAGEFVDYREYAPGDDLRRLDWKAMARTGRSYLKLFQDETDLRCTLLLDCSGSMNQGSQLSSPARGSKLEWMQYFSTALTHLIILGRDAVGMSTVHERASHFIAPVGTVQQRDLIFHAIQQLSAGGPTDLSSALDDVLVKSRRRGVLLVISDFLVPSLAQVVASIRKFRARGWEVIAIHLVHPDEEQLPRGNAFQFVGWEEDGRVNCQVAEIRQAYQERFAQHLQFTRNSLYSVGCDYHVVRTAESYLDVLRSFMVLRSA